VREVGYRGDAGGIASTMPRVSPATEYPVAAISAIVAPTTIPPLPESSECAQTDGALSWSSAPVVSSGGHADYPVPVHRVDGNAPVTGCGWYDIVP
jgi:hypothetical protein